MLLLATVLLAYSYWQIDRALNDLSAQNASMNSQLDSLTSIINLKESATLLGQTTITLPPFPTAPTGPSSQRSLGNFSFLRQ